MLRGRRGAGVIEYAILIFVVIVAAFAAWRYLGGSVKGSTDSAQGKFSGGGGGGGQAAAGGGDQSGGSNAKQGSGQQTTVAQGGGGGGGQKSGTPGEAKVAHVAKPGEAGAPVDNRAGPGRHGGAADDTAPKKSNWFKYAMIALLVVGLMAAVYSFGKKKSTA